MHHLALAGSDLVAGAEVGAFVARTGSGSLVWERLGSGLPRVTVWGRDVAPHGRIVAGTHGRGDWEVRPGR